MWKLILRIWRVFLGLYIIKIDFDIVIVPAFDVKKNLHKEPFPAFKCIPLKTCGFNYTEYVFMVFLCVVFAPFEPFLLIYSFHVVHWCDNVIFSIIYCQWDVLFVPWYVNLEIECNLSCLFWRSCNGKWDVNIGTS